MKPAAKFVHVGIPTAALGLQEAAAVASSITMPPLPPWRSGGLTPGRSPASRRISARTSAASPPQTPARSRISPSKVPEFVPSPGPTLDFVL